MAKEFTLEGEIGWAVGTWDVRNMLQQAKGEDIKLNWASPGGSVITGIKIYNMIKKYSGKVDFHLIGEAASMGSYIPLAGDRITAEPNAVFMIHNARNWVGGDHNKMRKMADVVEGFSNILKTAYVAATGKTVAEVTQMMDDETFFFGKDMVDAGFVDEIVGDADRDPDAKSVHIALAQEAFKACMKKLRDEEPDDYEQVAALLESNAGSLLTDKTPVKGSRDNLKTEVKKVMDIEKLKADFPGLVATLLAEGRKEGVTAERARVSAHLTLGEASGDTKTAFAAIKDGAEMDVAFQATYLAAGMRKGSIEDRQTDDGEAAVALAKIAADKAAAETDEETIAAGLEKKFGVVPEKK